MNAPFDSIPSFEEPPDLEIRYTEPKDITFLEKWFADPAVLRWFPMKDPREVDDSVKRWIAYHQYKCSLTACLKGIPCGIATLWLQPYRKVSHQCQFGIIVDPQCRGKRIGSSLMKNIMNLAKKNFRIEMFHLEVYEGNPAYHLYKSFGFREFGRQSHWVKDDGEYIARICMERFL